MFNRDGGPSVDVYPDAPKWQFGQQPGANTFQGFDPISQEAKWLHDVVENAHSCYHDITGT